MKETITVNLKVLKWFGDQIDGIEAFAQLCTKNKQTQQNILNGILTKTQAISLAHKANKPVGFLLLDTIPQEIPIAIADLRTRADALPLDDNFKKIYLDAVYKQDWLIETRKTLDVEELNFIGKFNSSDKVKEIVEDMKVTLNPPHPKNQVDIESYYKNLVKCAEKVGILVLQNSCVINNTRRKLDTNQFLGFAVVNNIAPVIFINTADKSKAKVFTLIHELAHLWLNASGISESYRSMSNKIEIMCNRVAGEFLVPQSDFLALWQDDVEHLVQIQKIGNKFKVSPVVVATIALINKKITEQEFREIHQKYKAKDEKASKSGSKAMQIASVINRSGSVLAKMVSTRLTEGYIDYKDASLLLNVPINKVTRYVNKE